MTRYWFAFSQRSDAPIGLSRGCGVTAYNYDDAINILKMKVFKSGEFPDIERVVEDIDIRTLDNGHVLPNMQSPSERGVWFPMGYGF